MMNNSDATGYFGLGEGIGLVLSMSHGGVEIIDRQNISLFATISGGAKHRQQRKRLLAVGDRVNFVKKTGNVIIEKRLERRSELTRFDERGNEHVIAANMDTVLIVVSCDCPPLKPGLIDRYLLASKLGKLRPVIAINKADLAKDMQEIEKVVKTYRDLGISVWVTSSKDDLRGIEDLSADLVQQWVIFSGQSGVGKTSIAAALTGIQGMRTAEVLKETGKGRHTTSLTRVFPLPNGGALVDAPGIRSFGLSSLTKEQVLSGFPEFEKFSHACDFRDCSHLNEFGCAVQRAVGAPEGIKEIRYESYCRFILELKLPSYLRPDHPQKSK